MTRINGVDIHFLAEKPCTLCESYFDIDQGPMFLDLDDQLKHFQAVHPFILKPKSAAMGGN
jgi:hypothetical protein